MEAVVLEIYDRRGHVRFRQKLTALPATLGRSNACDVIIDDPLVSAIHARLEEDAAGILTLVDAGSQNKLRLGNTRVDRVTFPTPRKVLLGGTRIGVARASAPIEKTGVHRISRLDQPWLVLPALALMMFGAYYVAWLKAHELKPINLIGDEVLTLLFVVVAWAAAWSIATRIAQGHFNFLGHLTVAAFTFGAMGWYTAVALPLVDFVFHLSPLVGMFLDDGVILMAGWMLAMHLVRVTGWTRRRCLAIAFSLAVTFMGVTGFRRLMRQDDFDAGISPSNVALPPAFVVGQVDTVDGFLDGTVALQKKVDALRVAK